jgi:DNA-damage-inducible protein J
MAQTNINIRMDETVKKQAESLFNELGLNMTTAFNIFVRQAIRQRKIPFEIAVEDDPVCSGGNIAYLRRALKAAEAGKLTEHELVED